MTLRIDRSPWAPLALALAWLAATAWLRPLALPDEGRYVGVAWHMLTSGDWIVPRLDGLPYFHKPPLFYWITASSLWAFGTHEWAARLAPWLGAAAGTTAVYVFARSWWGDRVARLALLALVTQPLVFVGAQFANLDMLVAGCIGASILGFAHAALLPAADASWRRALAAGYLFAALGVLAKGLIGAALPALVIGIWLAVRGEWKQIPRLLWLPGLALFLLVTAPWFVAMQLRFPDFGHYFFVIQHFARYAQSGFNNQQPFWFFPVVLALLALPWSIWLVAKPRGGNPPAPEPTTRALRQLLWIWLAAVTLFFSLPQSKLVGYILPATWPLAMLVAERFRGALAESRRAGLLWRASGATAIAVCVGAVAVAALVAQKSSRELGLAMLGKVGAQDRVVLLHEYEFDLPFYAGLTQPSIVVEDWDGQAVRRDNWRKELADAGQFDEVRARSVLVMPAAWQASLCHAGAVWVVGSQAAAVRYPVLRQAEVVAVQHDRTLWRFAPNSADVLRAAGCAGKPSANSGGTS